MSTAEDIFNSIISGDNINTVEHISTALYNRSNLKLEDMKEYVGSRLFKEGSMPGLGAMNNSKKPMQNGQTQNNSDAQSDSDNSDTQSDSDNSDTQSNSNTQSNPNSTNNQNNSNTQSNPSSTNNQSNQNIMKNKKITPLVST